MKTKIAEALLPLLSKVRTDARGVKKKGGKPYKEDKPLDLEALLHHVNGGPAYGAYLIRPGEDHCMMAVLDLDSHKGETSWEDMADTAFAIQGAALKRGLCAHLWRSSGGSGIHIIFVWPRPQSARCVRIVLREVIAVVGLKDGAGGVAKGEVEIFPKQDKVAVGAYGNYPFLPGAFESVPLEEFTLEPLTKADIVGYLWIDSADVPDYPEEETPRYSCNVEADIDEVIDAVSYIPNPNLAEDGALDYETWFRIIAGIHSADSGETGHELAEAWSEKSDKHDRKWFEHTWANLKARDDGVGVGTIFLLARAHGWDRYGPAVAASLDEIDIDAAVAAIPASLSGTISSVAVAVSVSAASPFYLRNRFGVANTTLDNVVEALRYPQIVGEYSIGYDEFTDDIKAARTRGQWRRVDDVEMINWRARLARASDGNDIPGVGRETMRDAVLLIAKENAFDSAIEWIESLAWDGVPRVERFFAAYMGAEDSQYVRSTAVYMWTALAGRVLVPGCKVDIMPILVGEQGTYKSTAVAEMVPSSALFVELDFSKKDDDLARLLRGKLVAEVGELKGMRGRSLEHTKAFITRREEKWVPKFREFETTFKRRCVLIGTTNDDDFLEDMTGARRFNPIRVTGCDPRAIARDREQLWAEAAVMFKRDLATGGEGVIWDGAQELAKNEHDEFTLDDAWEGNIRHWLDEQDEGVRFRVSDCLSGAISLPVAQQHSGHIRRAARVLKKLGYVETRARVNGVNARFWFLPGVPHA